MGGTQLPLEGRASRAAAPSQPQSWEMTDIEAAKIWSLKCGPTLLIIGKQ